MFACACPGSLKVLLSLCFPMEDEDTERRHTDRFAVLGC